MNQHKSMTGANESRELQITAPRGWTANMGKISFYSMVHIQNLAYVNDGGSGCEEVIVVRKAFGSKKLSVGQRIAGFLIPGR